MTYDVETKTNYEMSGDDLMVALGGAMERMAFVCPMPPEGPEPLRAPESPVRVTMDLRRPGEERPWAAIEIIAGHAFGRLLAANIIGDPSVTPSDAESVDALRELVNVACGAAIRDREQAGAGPMTMGIPTVTPCDAAAWADFAGRPGAVLLDADGHSVGAMFRRR